jgi:hypothetical protein
MYPGPSGFPGDIMQIPGIPSAFPGVRNPALQTQQPLTGLIGVLL